MDPRRLLASTASGYKATVSYGERTLVPPFHCGVFAGAVEAVGGKNVKATGSQTGFLEAEYHVSWD